MRALVFLMVAVSAGCVQMTFPLPEAPLPETMPVHGNVPTRGTAVVDIVTLGVVEAPAGLRGIATTTRVAVSAGGSGQLDIDSVYAVGRDTRSSAVDAIRAANTVAGTDASAFDYRITIGPQAGILSGPSAGSQFALAFYVAIHNLAEPSAPLAIDPHYAGTGTITPEGIIGGVGGIPYKLAAAAAVGTTFAYPAGPVLVDGRWLPAVVDMPAACAAAAMECTAVDTLADLITVATVPARR